MRTYGRIDGRWVEVDSDTNGFDDPIWLTTLAQCIKLSPGESPFYADYGIPAQQSVISQVLPTYYMSNLQTQFAKYFASLVVSQNMSAPADSPTYNVDVLTNQGSQIVMEVAL